MRGTIVCGVTESRDGRSAAELAQALGSRLGLRVVLVHVVDGVPTGTDESLTARQRQNGAEQALNEIARDLGSGPEKRVVLGDRAEAVAQVAAEEGADLIVVGSRSAGLGSRKLRSTLARELDATTPVPVLVAPPSTRRRSDHLSVPAHAAEREDAEAIGRGRGVLRSTPTLDGASAPRRPRLGSVTLRESDSGGRET